MYVHAKKHLKIISLKVIVKYDKKTEKQVNNVFLFCTNMFAMRLNDNIYIYNIYIHWFTQIAVTRVAF